MNDRDVREGRCPLVLTPELNGTRRNRSEWVRGCVRGDAILLVQDEPEVDPADLSDGNRRVASVDPDAVLGGVQSDVYDTAVLGDALGRTRDPVRLIARACDMLRPGGLLLLSAFDSTGDEGARGKGLDPLRLVALAEGYVELRSLERTNDGFACVVGERPENGHAPALVAAEALLKWTAACAGGVERALERLRRENAELREQRQALIGKERDHCDGNTTLINERNELRRQVSAARFEAETAQASAARMEFLSGQIDHFRSELELCRKEVRYRVGDAIVRAARPSLDTLKLPGRLAKLFSEGLRRVGDRRDEGNRLRTAPTAKLPTASPALDAPGPVRPARDGPVGSGSACIDPVSLLTKPFQTAPRELWRRDDLRIALVSDEFSWSAWQFEAETWAFTPRAWQGMFKERQPDLLLVESTWKGIGDKWYFELRQLGSRRDMKYVIPRMVAWCRQRGIPTVFYNKEDPPNFEVFVDVAAEFDYVFTSDGNCIPHYCDRTGHERVFALPFAAQPRIHNPMATDERVGQVCFAGTWYSKRHSSRRSDADNLFRPALDYDFHIFDRMAQSRDEAYAWPEEFRGAVRGGLPYSQMIAAYKRYKVFLNVNSVKNSPTMFSRRVFELLACGTPVISSYSRGIEEVLGTDVVLMSDSPRTTRDMLERVLGDDDYRERLSLRGQRAVFSTHTYTHRLQAVLDAIKLEYPPVGRPLITMIAMVEHADEVIAAWQSYGRQDYENTRLVYCATDASAVANVDHVTGSDPSVRVVLLEGAAWGRPMCDAIKSCRPGFVAALNPADYYGRHYLTDYAHATLYVSDSGMGKASYYRVRPDGAPLIVDGGAEYRTVERVNPWTMCLTRDEAARSAIALVETPTRKGWWDAAMRRAPMLYASDRFNYLDCTIGDDTESADRRNHSIGGTELFRQAENTCA
ncbi:MAG: glycosyltransferase [Planctomycetes bacterium]|nr:glycosyltransferase [Planctomycetota bacterium]